ncbi:hypothetical protein L7F22_021394 [Adiantum nelumboides]|nr:hypothetical protein [Adiantum nelumboides]
MASAIVRKSSFCRQGLARIHNKAWSSFILREEISFENKESKRQSHQTLPPFFSGYLWCLVDDFRLGVSKSVTDAFRALKSLNLTPAEINMFASYTVMDELLYYLDRICVPHNGALRKILIQEHQEVPFAAHPGINKTYRLLSATYFWPQMQQDVIKYVKDCHSCQIMKASRQLPQGLLQSMPIPKERWESISFDFITTLLRTTKGNAQILVIVDRFSKMAHFIPCKKAASAPDIASLFVQHIFKIHGLPRSIISDRDPEFTRHFWTSLFKSLGTNLLFSSAYHPQTDGQTERVNQILEKMLRHYIQIRLASWEEYLPLVEFAYNIAPHSIIGMIPFQAAYGHTPLVPTNFVLQHKVALTNQLVQEMQDILVQVRDKLVHVQQKYQKQVNKHRRHAEFNEGDLVLLYVASHRYKTVKSVFPKLRPRFYGPFQIIKKNLVVNYKLELPPSWGKLHPTFHISWLKQYIRGDSSVLELSSYVPEIEDEHVILAPEMIIDVRPKETSTETLVLAFNIRAETTLETLIARIACLPLSGLDVVHSPFLDKTSYSYKYMSTCSGRSSNEANISYDERRRTLNRILYRSRQRGYLELDLILGKWTEENIQKLDDQQLKSLVEILDMENPELWKWLTGQEVMPSHLSENPNTDEAYRKIKLALEKTQSKQKKAADQHRRELVFSLGDWVLLRFEKARLRKMKGKEHLFPKLGMRYYGPFQVCDKISDVAYRLKLPEGWKIHNAFHVSLLRPFVGDMPEDIVSEEQSEVEELYEILVP